MSKIPILLLAAACLYLAACSGTPGKADDGPHRAKKVVGDFSLRNLKGKTIRLSDYEEKVVMLSFWATWCEPCRTELPQLQKIWDEFREQGFELVSIAVDPPDLENTVRQMARRNRYKFPVLLDQDTEVSNRFNPTMTLPFGIIIDRDGRLFTVHQGYRIGDEEVIKEEIRELLTH